MRSMSALALLIFVVLWGAAAQAQPKWAVGQTYSGNIDIGGVQMALPAGEWVVTGFQASFNKTQADSTVPGASMVVALAQPAGNALRGYAVFVYNERSVSNGWTAPDAKNCRRAEIHHAKIVRDVQLSKSCQYVNHIVYSVSANSAQWWKDSVEFARSRGIAMPLVTIASGIVVSDRANYVSALYHFNPAVKGFPAPSNTVWASSDWNVANVAADEKKKAFVQSVVDWTEKSRPLAEAGLAGKLKKGDGLDWPAAMQ
ncbi:MAG: hypothetical protein ACK4FK_03755 [Ferrovibrio sp.]|jgi:hypothetical protein|uniref:hypothetical protein n=1 Tax=Ferrovibrio sp. TaxID=1917215 RepID=UPI00391908A8